MSTPKHGINWYRKEHKAVPAELYDFKWKATQMTKGGLVHKSNYAPLGRVPSVVKSDKTARRKYETAHDTLTLKGYKDLPLRKRKAYRPPYGVEDKYITYMHDPTLLMRKKAKKRTTARKTSAARAKSMDKQMGEFVIIDDL